MNQSKKIIILTSYFYPENIIGSTRITKLFKFLNMQENFELKVIHTKSNEVILEDSILNNDVQSLDSLIVLNKTTLSGFMRKLKRNLKKKKHLVKMNVKNSKSVIGEVKSYILRFFKQSISLASQVLEVLLEQADARIYFNRLNGIIDIENIDVVYSTYSPLHPHLIATMIKKKYPHITWIAEFRDPIFQYDTPKLLQKFSKNFISKRANYIDLVVYPTLGYLKHLYIPSSMNKLLLRNGYDSNDIIKFDLNKNHNNSELTICLAGSYYTRVSLMPLFDILNKMIKDNHIIPSKLKFIYVGTETQRIENELSLNENLVPVSLLPLMTRGDVFNRVYSISDIVINLSHNNTDFDDILTGKLFELLMLKKPIIALTFGNGDNKELYEIIEKTKIGIVIENNKLEEDSTVVMDFIKKIYDHKFNGLAYLHEPNIEALEEYEYKKVFNRLIDYINSLSRGYL